jgi:glycosyltransferase involved in cell wall biosynthesis
MASSSSGSRGGGEIYLLQAAEAMCQAGHEVLLWCSTHERMNELAATFAVFGKVIRHPYLNTYDRRTRCFGQLLNGVGAIVESWKRAGPDVVHVNKQNREDGLDLLRAAESWGGPRGCTIHLTQSAVELGAVAGVWRDWIASLALRRFRGAWSVVESRRGKALRDLAGAHAKIHRIPPAMQAPSPAVQRDWRHRAREQWGAGERDVIVAAVGRMVDQKRPFRFLEVALNWKLRGAVDQVVWIGDGPLRPAWESQAQGRARVTGWVSDVRRWLAGADLLFHSGAYEGLPLAFVDAWSLGLPVAVFPDLLSQLDDVSAGEILAIQDPTFIPAREDLDHVAQNGQQRFQREHRLETMAARLFSFYRDCEAQTASPASGSSAARM